MDPYDNTRKAIDVMTAWATDNPNETDFSMERLREYVSEGPDGEAELMLGLVNLAGYVLIRLEVASGQTMQWHLQDIARKLIHK